MKPIIYFSLLLIAFSSCKKSNTSSTLISDLENTGTVNIISDRGGSGEFQYSQDIGTSPKDVYFVFSNGSATSQFTKPTISGSQTEPIITKTKQTILPNSRLTPGWDQATIFNSTQFQKNLNKGQASNANFVTTLPDKTVVGDIYSFKNESETDLIAATAKKVVTDGTITVNIWVADDAFEGSCSKSFCMTQAMVDAVADKFLVSGSNNDIYDWVTQIYGAPWGVQTPYSNLIRSTKATDIHILYFDIPSTGVLGFFWSKDNLLASSQGNSNERLMFYMDSIYMSVPNKDSAGNYLAWDASHFYPQMMISTLAHEFQHMIHLFQKAVLREPTGSSSETWINEMASEVTEDLVADKMQINGPRGVTYNDATAGSSGNTTGRLPGFIQYYNISLNTWVSGSATSYYINYAFGAFIARNFGGAALMQKIVQSAHIDSTAITEAISELGYTQEDGSKHTMASLLSYWGAAVMLSDQTNAPTGMQYNLNSFFTNPVDSINYNLGSINIFNYGTPSFDTASTLGNKTKLPSYSNTYVKIGTDLTGTLERKISLPEGVNLTVIAK